MDFWIIKYSYALGIWSTFAACDIWDWGIFQKYDENNPITIILKKFYFNNQIFYDVFIKNSWINFEFNSLLLE